MTELLEAAIGTWEKRPGFLILKPNGLPFRREQLSDHWLRERTKNAALAPLIYNAVLGETPTYCYNLQLMPSTVSHM